MPTINARTAALRALSDLREGRRTARQAIESLIDRYGLPAQERPLAMELVHGVVRHRLTLAAVLSKFTRGRWQNIARQTQHTLMLAAYQIIWLDSVPVFAAVNEAVNQAKAEGGQRTGQFVNAVLRQLDRSIEQRRIASANADPTRAVPIELDSSCLFSIALFPDPAKRAIEYLSQTTSHPGWLVSRWMDAYGPQQTATICMSGMLRPPIVLRPNRLKADVASLVAKLADVGFEPAMTADGESIVLGHAAHIGQSPLLQEGLFQPQDPTAQLPVRRMHLQQNACVLDLCAGVGTKTTQMAEALAGSGRAIATDVDDAKLATLRESKDRLGYTNIDIVPLAEVADRVRALPRLDWVLIDAPCSNTGVLARRPEVRYRLTARALSELGDTQLSLLERAAELAGADTKLMYSTCSIDPEENEQVCTRFLQARPEWQLVENRLTLPNPGPTAAYWHDGGYWAILARR